MSMMSTEAGIDLRALIKKTGHELQEIRLRALENILSKLRNQIVFIEDLVHHRELMVNLLQWFNHESPKKVGEVLQLIERLSKHCAAASILQSIGGVEFFSIFRQDVAEKEHLELIDSILDSLFWIPTDERAKNDNQSNIQTEYATSPVANVKKPEAAIGNSFDTQGAFREGKKGIPITSFSTISAASVLDSKSSITENAEDVEMRKITNTQDDGGINAGQSALSAEWVVLTSSDRHILSVTESRLQSHNMEIVGQSCEFFRDVLLQDFPAYIFIQRPNIVKTFLGLLDSFAGKDEGFISVVLGCVNELTLKLLKSSLQEGNPDLVQISKINEIYSSTESSANTEISSLHSRTTSLNGDGMSRQSVNSMERDLRSNVESDPEDFEGELLTEALQQSQWTGFDYCLQVISTAVTFTVRAVQTANRCEEVVLLANNVLDVLGLYNFDSVWNGDHDRKIYDIMTCLRHINDLIQLCLDTKDRLILQSEDSSYSADVESIFALLANATAISIRFINVSVPPDRVFEAVPENLLASFKLIFADEIMAQSYPAIRASLLSIMKVAEESFFENFKAASSVISSMKSTKTFMEEARHMEKNSMTKLQKLVEICQRSIYSVGFHQCEMFIRNSVRLVSHIYRLKDPPCEVLKAAKDIILRLLSYHSVNVKEIAYQTCLEIMTDAMNDSHVTNPLSTAYKNALFAINTDVLYEIGVFGLESGNKKITNYAANVLVTLLFGRLNMPAQIWKTVIRNITPVFPLLQCFSSIDQALERALTNVADASNTLLTSNGDSCLLAPLEQLRASFRFMFVKNEHIRAKGFSSLVWILTQDDSKNGKSARYRHEMVQNASDMLLVDPVLSSKYKEGIAVPSGFAGSNLEHLWDVFVSSTVDESLKESAAEQLAVIIQDSKLHKQMLDKDADKVIARTLHHYVKKVNAYSLASVETSLKMLLSCVIMLRHLAQHNTSVRHTLAVDKSTYLDVFRCRLAFGDVESMHYETSCLIAFLAFDELFKGTSDEISLPSLIVRRYLLPFNVATYELSTVQRERNGTLNEDKLIELRAEPFYSTIRVKWNLILAGSTLDVKNESQNENSAHYKEPMQLTEREVKILRELLSSHLIKQHLDILKNSDNAVAIANAMKDLKKHILAFVCQFNAYPSVGKEEFFTKTFQEFISYMRDQNVMKRLLHVSSANASFLRSFVQFCQLLGIVNSNMSMHIDDDIFKQILEDNGPISAAITNYTLLRARQSDSLTSDRETYDLTNENRSLFKNILGLVSSVSVKLNLEEEPDATTSHEGIGDFILLVVQSLSRVESTSYYDLPVLEITLDCLSHITYKRGWSLHYNGSGEELCNFMANIFMQILHSFHIDRIGVSTSFMGKGVMTKVALCLCHVAMENQTFCTDKDWTASWMSQPTVQQADGDVDNSLPWLLPLLTDRNLDVRWSGWSLSTALLNGPVGAESVVNEFQVFPGGVWASAVGVILDELENSLVRCQTCKLISTSLSNLTMPQKQTENDLWDSMVVQDTQSQANISGLPAFLLLLDHFHFFSKIKEILMQKALVHSSGLLGTAYHNVSTSCSTPASEPDQYYERILGDSHDEQSTDASAAGSRSGSNRAGDAMGASSECLLLSSTNTMSETSQQERNVYRFSIQQHEQKREIKAETQRHPCCNTKLKSSLFQLICKLLEIDAENIIASLETEGLLDIMVRSLDADFVRTLNCLQKKSLTMQERKSFNESAEMTSNLLKAINLVLSNHKAMAFKLPNNGQFSLKLTSLFDVAGNFFSKSLSISKPLFAIWNEALRLLIKMCTGNQSLEKTTTEDTILKNFSMFAVSYGHAVAAGRHKQDTMILFLSLFKCILCREGRRHSSEKILLHILDAPFEIPQLQGQNNKPVVGTVTSESCITTPGESLCNIFIDQLNRSQMDGQGRKSILFTLSSLFVVSTSSKLFAVEHGFLESVIEDIKDIHVKLNLASLELGKEELQRRKEKALLLELVDIFGLLRNLLHAHMEMKKAAVKSGLLMSLQKMWSWCLVDKSLKVSILEVLCTMTSNCPEAHEAICHGGPPLQRTAHDDNSLFQSILKLLVRLNKDCMAPTGKIENSVRISFQLLTNLAVMPDVRSLIWKTNFLQHFKSCQVGQSANKKQKVASKVLTALWIQFLLVLSFHADGAHAILKVNDMLPSLIDMSTQEQHRDRQKCLLILRNLLYFPANKPSLITNGQLTSCLLNALDTECIWSRAIVVTCFASLLHNCHKAKVALKKTRLLAKLQLLNEEVISGKMLSMNGDIKGYEQLKASLQRTITTLMK